MLAMLKKSRQASLRLDLAVDVRASENKKHTLPSEPQTSTLHRKRCKRSSTRPDGSRKTAGPEPSPASQSHVVVGASRASASMIPLATTSAPTLRRDAVANDMCVATHRSNPKRGRVGSKSKLKNDHVICDGCCPRGSQSKAKQITGWRWACAICLDIDFCTSCAMRACHDSSHTLVSAVPPGGNEIVKAVRELAREPSKHVADFENGDRTCTVCVQELLSFRLSCAVCTNYDLCERCFRCGFMGPPEQNGLHNEYLHPWLAIRKPMLDMGENFSSEEFPMHSQSNAGGNGSEGGFLNWLTQNRVRSEKEFVPQFHQLNNSVAQYSIPDDVKQHLLMKLSAISRIESIDQRQAEFRQLLRLWHPDKNSDRTEIATVVFQLLQTWKSRF